MQVSFNLFDFYFNLPFIAVSFFTEMLGPEEEGKISHVTTIDISERSTGIKIVDEGTPEEKKVPLLKLFKDTLALNKPKKGKKGKGKGGKKKKKK